MRTVFSPVLFLAMLGCENPKVPCGDGYERSDAGVCVRIEDSGGPVIDTPPSDDSATPEDSGDDPLDPDSGEPEDTAPPGPVVEATLSEGSAVFCTNPSARESEPVYTADFGPDWAAQSPVVGGTDPIAAGGMTVADLTGDGRMDIYLPQIGDDQLYVGQPDGTLSDESDARLITDGIPDATAATAVDVEGDGDLDLFVSTSTGANRLLRNDGSGDFTDGTDASGLGGQGWPGAHGVFGDMDGDDDLDLFVVTYRNCDPVIATDPENPWAETPQALWENQGDGTFIDVTDRIEGHPGIGGRLRAAAWIDVDGDADLDLHLVSDKSVSSPCMVDNLLFRNDGGSFVDVASDLGLNLQMEGMGLGIGDMNGDDTPDFVMSDMRRVWMMESDVGGWHDTTATHGLRYEPEERNRWSGWGTELADIDNDRDLDLYVSFGGLPDAPVAEMNPPSQADALFLQDASGMFSEVSADWGIDDTQSNRAVVTVDINGDGWLDLGRRKLNGFATIELARCGDAAWLQVALDAPGANPRAVGAMVLVQTGDQTQRRWLTAGGTGLQSSTEPVAHFGLGEAETVDLLEVMWPDGGVSRFTDVGTKRTVTVTRLAEE